MSEIDWSKAPEGATHYGAEDSIYVECWYKQCEDGWLFAAANSDWKWSERKTSISPGRLRDLIPRPSPAWSGEGLPPVGCECEVRAFAQTFKDGEWIKCKIAFVDDRGAYLHSDQLLKGNCVGFPLDNLEFRPIRTPEQIATDERADTIKRMREIWHAQDGCMGKLYDAGLRFVKP